MEASQNMAEEEDQPMMKCVGVPLLAFAAVLATAAGASAQLPERPLEVGQKAPDFVIPATVPVPAGGSTVSVSALTGMGKTVVVAFFPKAFTGG